MACLKFWTRRTYKRLKSTLYLPLAFFLSSSDQVKHVNDINNEMLAQIRRSNFIVAYLTEYREGVYWEAWLAYL